MSLFVVEVDPSSEVESFAETSNNTLVGDPVAGMWFEPGSYVSYTEGDGRAWLVGDMKPQFPPFWLHCGVAVFTWLIIFFFSGFVLSLWLVLPVLVTVTLLWHTKYFPSFMMRLGLKKWGYSGKFDLLSNYYLFRNSVRYFNKKGGLSTLNRGFVDGEKE